MLQDGLTVHCKCCGEEGGGGGEGSGGQVAELYSKNNAMTNRILRLLQHALCTGRNPDLTARGWLMNWWCGTRQKKYIRQGYEKRIGIFAGRWQRSKSTNTKRIDDFIFRSRKFQSPHRACSLPLPDTWKLLATTTIASNWLPSPLFFWSNFAYYIFLKICSNVVTYIFSGRVLKFQLTLNKKS